MREKASEYFVAVALVLSLLIAGCSAQCGSNCLRCSAGRCTSCRTGYRVSSGASHTSSSSSSSTSSSSSSSPSPAANVSVQTSLIVLLGVAGGLAFLFAIILFVVYWNCWRPQILKRAKRISNYENLTPDEGGPLPWTPDYIIPDQNRGAGILPPALPVQAPPAYVPPAAQNQ